MLQSATPLFVSQLQSFIHSKLHQCVTVVKLLNCLKKLIGLCGKMVILSCDVSIIIGKILIFSALNAVVKTVIESTEAKKSLKEVIGFTCCCLLYTIRALFSLMFFFKIKGITTCPVHEHLHKTIFCVIKYQECVEESLR